MVRRLALILLLAAVSACERTPSGPEGGAPIAMSVRFPDGWRPASAAQLVSMTLKVSGPDMEPIWRRRVALFDANATDSTRMIHDTVSVPVGPARTFQVALSDSGGVFLYGEATVDLPRGDAPFYLPVYLVVPPPPIVRIIRSFGYTGFLSPSFLDYWIQTQALSLGYIVEYDDAGFNLTGADLVVIPQPYIEGPYSASHWDSLRAYLEFEHGSVLFLGDEREPGDWTPITRPLGFVFGAPVLDSVQYEKSHRVPYVTGPTTTGFLAPGDTLMFVDGVRCNSYDTTFGATSTPIARYSSGAYPPAPDSRFGSVPVAAIQGTYGGGQFIAVGDIDWIGPPTSIVVDSSSGASVITGLDAKQHRNFAESLLRKLAPPFSFEAP